MNSQKNFKFYLLLIVGVVFFEGVAQYHIKKSRITKNSLYILVSILAYSMVCLLLKRCYEFNGIGITNLTWSVISIITMLSIGVIMFNEEITRYDIMGVFLCLLGMYLIFIKGHRI